MIYMLFLFTFIYNHITFFIKIFTVVDINNLLYHILKLQSTSKCNDNAIFIENQNNNNKNKQNVYQKI